MASLCLQAQTFYQMQFTIHETDRNVPVSALYVMNANDSGFIRVRYMDSVSNQDFIYQAELSETFIQKDSTSYFDDRAYVHTTNPQTWGANPIMSNKLPVFLFQKKTESYVEPVGIYYPNGEGKLEEDKEANFTCRFLEESLLTKKLLSRFFFEGEPLMTSLLENNTKGFSSKEKNTKIHLLIVADTTDPKIGKSSGMNVRYVESFYTDLSKYIGCPINIRKVMGSSYNRNNVASELKLLTPEPNDILIFYYSGHGYRKDDDKRRFPYFDLRATDEEDYLTQTMQHEDVQGLLEKKNARLTLVFSDCCNSHVDASNPIAPPPLAKKSLAHVWNEKNVRALFLDPTKKMVLSTAADSSQYAAFARAFGGLFSFSLNNALLNATSKNDPAPTWFTLLEATRNETLRLSRRSDCSARLGPGARCYHVPVYRIR
jgi:hypothetical protein